MRDTRTTGTVELVLLGALWGSIGVLVKDVRVASPVIATLRMAIGCVAVLAYHLIRGRLGELKLHRQRGLLIADGILLGAHWVLMFESFKRLPIATAILIIFVGPVLVALAARRVLGERIERRTIVSLALSVIGMVLITGPAWRGLDPWGVAFAFASAVGFAALMLAGKRLTRVYRPATILVWQLGIGAVAVAPLAFLSGSQHLAAAMPSLLALGLAHTALAGIVYFRALTVVKAQHVGVLTYLEPATAILYAWVFLSEKPSVATLIGGALILIGGLNVVIAKNGLAGSPQDPLAPPTSLRASLKP